MTIDQRYEIAAHTPSDIIHHMTTLRQYASQSKHVTEFGVRYGMSTIALMAGRPKKLVSYDTHLLFPLEEFHTMARQAGVEFEFCQQNVLEADIEPTGFLFIDTYHSYGQLKAELARHAAKVQRFIGLHDTVTYGHVGMDGQPRGLLDAWEEFTAEHPQCWFPVHSCCVSNGLMIFQRTELVVT
jgi:hypothetical protein